MQLALTRFFPIMCFSERCSAGVMQVAAQHFTIQQLTESEHFNQLPLQCLMDLLKRDDLKVRLQLL